MVIPNALLICHLYRQQAGQKLLFSFLLLTREMLELQSHMWLEGLANFSMRASGSCTYRPDHLLRLSSSEGIASVCPPYPVHGISGVMRAKQLPSLFLSPLFLTPAGGVLFPGHRMKTHAREVPGHPEGTENPSLTLSHKTQFHLEMMLSTPKYL